MLVQVQVKSYDQAIGESPSLPKFNPKSPYTCRCWDPKWKVKGSGHLLEAGKKDGGLQSRDMAWVTLSAPGHCPPSVGTDTPLRASRKNLKPL